MVARGLMGPPWGCTGVGACCTGAEACFGAAAVALVRMMVAAAGIGSEDSTLSLPLIPAMITGCGRRQGVVVELGLDSWILARLLPVACVSRLCHQCA